MELNCSANYKLKQNIYKKYRAQNTECDTINRPSLLTSDVVITMVITTFLRTELK